MSAGSTPLFGILYRDWRRLRAKAGAIPRRARGRLWHITIQSLLNEALQFEENRQLGSQIEAQKVPTPVFVLGLARSGTTLLYQLMALDPRLSYCTFNQAFGPHTFLLREGYCKGLLARILRRINFLWLTKGLTKSQPSPASRGLDNVLVSVNTPEEDDWALLMSGYSNSLAVIFAREPDRMRLSETDRQEWQRLWLRFLKKLTFRYPGKRLVLKSPGHMERLHWILELFPDAKVVFIHRDPPEIYRSLLGAVKWMSSRMGFQGLPANLERLCLESHRDRFAAFLATRHLVKPGNLHYVSYRDLLAAPARALEDIYESLNLGDFDPCRERVLQEWKKRERYQVNSYEDLEPEITEQLRLEWRAYYEEFGY